MQKRCLFPLLLRLVVLPLWAAGQAMAHHLPPGMEEVDEFAHQPLAAALTYPPGSAGSWIAILGVVLMIGSWLCKTGFRPAALCWAGTGLVATGAAIMVSGFAF